MRMLGRVRPSWCPICRAPAGVDCPDSGKATREVKRREHRMWLRDEIRAHEQPSS